MHKLTKYLITLTALPLVGGSLALGNPKAESFSSLQDLQENLPEGQALLFSGAYLSDTVGNYSSGFRHQIGMSFEVEEGTELLGFVVHLVEDLPARERDWSLRLWRFGDAFEEVTQTVTRTDEEGEEIEVEETVEKQISHKTGSRPYGGGTGNHTTEGSLAVQSNSSEEAFSAGDYLVVRLAEPVTATDTEDFWYGFSIHADDRDAQLARLGGNPAPDTLNGFEQMNANTWRSVAGGGDRIIEFEVIVADASEETDEPSEDVPEE
ncbi:MAG: hypothetical protein LAT55_09185 [Opitutales bacterium]|nr:hypothetical protein [Opitutales bacterium]